MNIEKKKKKISLLFCIQSRLNYIQSTYIYAGLILFLFRLILFIFSQRTCIQSHLICIQSDHMYLVWFYFIFSQLICIQSDLIYILSFFKYKFSHIEFIFIFCKYVQCAVRHVENFIKICLFFFLNACYTIISYKEIL